MPEPDFFDTYVQGMKKIADSLPDLVIPHDMKISIYRLAESNGCTPQVQLHRMLVAAGNLEAQQAIAKEFATTVKTGFAKETKDS